MEKYRKAMIVRIILLSVLAAIGVGIGIFDVFWAQVNSDSFVFCFQCGFSVAMGIVAAVWIIRYSAIIRDETKMQLQYNKENDERMKAIKARAGLPVVLILSVAMILVGMIVGYFNAVIFYTLIAVASVQLIVSCIIKFIFMKIL